ncbi:MULTISPECIES: ABC transporter permease [Rhizobium]|uniref:ABC transporter permease n=1 Tax=Rhizobium wuzhouense TaxID=1986026 RepID=A0ABX5NPJ3_9HYPH|nr:MULTISPECIES: ABC transporter permease [Rhizobium]PYB69860.1 ABC transporter permease [Rhizobium wuzhouense]RKE77436.1 putative spermidine/putrescine transport system permease protein [Rhizobium sp. AG855]
MNVAKPSSVSGYLPLLVPAALLVLFFVVPFGSMLLISFYKNAGGGLVENVVTVANYERLFSPFFARLLGASFGLALGVAVISILIAFPFSYLLVNAPRSTQVCWLIFLLSILSLSESIIGFAWSTILSRTAGISNLLVYLGLLETPASYAPGLAALVAGVVYTAFPYAVLVLYPILSRVDPHIEEAARTLGTSPLRTFFAVVLPMQRNTIITTFLMIMVFTLGTYLMPQILGRPQHWTLSVAISDQALVQSNIPFAAALSVFLVIVTLLIVGAVVLFGRKERAQ